MKPRPTKNDPEVLKAAAQALLPEVMDWLKCNDSEYTEDEILNDLQKALQWNDDGYQIARNLDSWCPDAALVEILDGAYFAKGTARSKACEAWVKENGLTGQAIGSRVVSDRHPEAGVGTVLLNHSNGTSTVNFPKMGHVPEGQIGTWGLILEWERLKPYDNPKPINEVPPGVPEVGQSETEQRPIGHGAEPGAVSGGIYSDDGRAD